ncbi:MAG: IS66 family transposase [Thermoplasmata archaeon]
MSKRRNIRPVTFTADEWRTHEGEDRRREQQNQLLRDQMRDLWERIHALEGRSPPPPDWVKANALVRPEEERKKRGAVEGHEAHHRPAPPGIDATEEVCLENCPRCGEALGRPFAVEERLVEAIVPGHVRVTKYRIGRYRCGHCRKVRRARLAPEVVPPRSRFDWGSHFLVGYWSLQGLTTSGLQDLLATNYGLTVSAGAIDAMLRRSAELFAPSYTAIREAVRHGKSVHVDWTGWRVDGINHHLWDFLSPEAKAAYFTVARGAGHGVPERVLGKRRKDRILECDGATAFNALSGRKQRCWVHLLRHARRGLERWESVSDAPDWRGLRVLEKIARGVLAAARLSDESARRAEGARLRAHLVRWLQVEREGEAAQALRKFLTKHEDELWWWAEAGVAAQNNLAEQGLRPHIAKKRKLSWGSRTLGGAERFAALASVVQTGKMHGLSLRELGASVLSGQSNPFGFGPGPPNPR